MIAWGRKDLAKTLSLPEENVRVDSPYVGGGFGGKLWFLQRGRRAGRRSGAKAVGRPVKIALTRPQMFNNATHRPATMQRVRLGGTRDGRLTAISHESLGQRQPAGRPAGNGDSADQAALRRTQPR